MKKKNKESENLLANATDNQYLVMKISETLKADSPLIEEVGKLLQEVKEINLSKALSMS